MNKWMVSSALRTGPGIDEICSVYTQQANNRVDGLKGEVLKARRASDITPVAVGLIAGGKQHEQIIRTKETWLVG